MCLKPKTEVQETCVLIAVKFARCWQSPSASAAQASQSLSWRHTLVSLCCRVCLWYVLCSEDWELGTSICDLLLIETNTDGDRPGRIRKTLCTETRFFYFSAVQRNRSYFALNERTETKK